MNKLALLLTLGAIIDSIVTAVKWVLIAGFIVVVGVPAIVFFSGSILHNWVAGLVNSSA